MIWLLVWLLLGCAEGGGNETQATVKPAPTKAVWDRNDEDDRVTVYRVYVCDDPGCIPSAVRATVPQTPLGEQPEWMLPKNINGGSIAVSAVNAYGESPLSDAVALPQKVKR